MSEYGIDLTQAIKDDTSGDYELACLQLMKGEREAGSEVNKDVAKAVAREAYQVWFSIPVHFEAPGA